MVAERCGQGGREEDCWARSSREASSKDDRPAISAMCRLEVGTGSPVVVMAWEANLNTEATNRAGGQIQQTSSRHLPRFHSMILEDLVVATAVSSVVRMVRLANRVGEVRLDRKGHWASSCSILLLLELLDQITCFVSGFAFVPGTHEPISSARELGYAWTMAPPG